MTRLGGWTEEGYLDIGQKKWWRSQILTFRPREVHFGIPFKGHAESHSVFDPEWLDSPTDPEFSRIRIPPKKKGLLATDWRGKFVFDFQLPPVEQAYRIRMERAGKGTHPVDRNVTLGQVRQQFAVYRGLAYYFHCEGLKVHVRESFGGKPRRFADS